LAGQRRLRARAFQSGLRAGNPMMLLPRVVGRRLILTPGGVGLRLRRIGLSAVSPFSVFPQPLSLSLLVARSFRLAFRSDGLLQTQIRGDVVQSRDHRSLFDEIAYVYLGGDDQSFGFCPNIGDFVSDEAAGGVDRE